MYAAENLSAFLDDALSRHERERVERHLAGCADCRHDLSTLRQTVDLLQKSPLRPAPRSFALPLSVQPEQMAYRRWNSAYGTMRAASVVVSFLLVLSFSGNALFGRWFAPMSQQPDMAYLQQSESERFVEEAPVRIQEAPRPAMAPMAAPAEAVAELLQPSPAQLVATLVLERRVDVSPMLAPPLGGGGEPSAKGDAPAVMSVPKPSGVGPAPASPNERSIVSVATSAAVGLAAAPQAEAALATDAVRESLVPSPTFFATVPQREAAQAATLAPEETPEAKLAMREAPKSDEPLAGPLEESQSPVVATPGAWYRAWYVVRVASGVLVGVLLMLVAGLLWIAPKRRT